MVRVPRALGSRGRTSWKRGSTPTVAASGSGFLGGSGRSRPRRLGRAGPDGDRPVRRTAPVPGVRFSRLAGRVSPLHGIRNFNISHRSRRNPQVRSEHHGLRHLAADRWRDPHARWTARSPPVVLLARQRAGSQGCRRSPGPGRRARASVDLTTDCFCLSTLALLLGAPTTRKSP